MLRPALEEFAQDQLKLQLMYLLKAVRQPNRDTHKESRVAGNAEAYENLVADLSVFAKQQLEKAKQ